VRSGALFIAVLLAACGGRAAIESTGGSAGAADAGVADTGAAGSASGAGDGGATEFVQCPPDGSALAGFFAQTRPQRACPREFGTFPWHSLTIKEAFSGVSPWRTAC
jgi:hypothetical protein